MTDYSALLSKNDLLHPTLTNRFKFKGFHFLADNRNTYLTLQTINASFEFNQSVERDYDVGPWIVTLVIEDDALGGVSNIINDVVPRFKNKYNTTFLEFDIMHENDTLQSVLTVTDATLTSARFDLDYANTMTAKWVLTFNAEELKRTT